MAAILDVAGVAARAGLNAATAKAGPPVSEESENSQLHSLLLFHNAPAEVCALSTESVTRVERVSPLHREP